MQSPKSYPVNTDYAFCEIKRQITDSFRSKSAIVKRIVKLPPPPPPPRCLSELVDERTIMTLYEEQNDGSYRDALRQAASGNKKSYLVWRKIWRAVDAAYQVGCYGIELAPLPRVHFLHRNILEIANLAGLGIMTHEGMAEFFADTCPCGKEHKCEAIRKLRRRWAAGKSANR